MRSIIYVFSSSVAIADQLGDEDAFNDVRQQIVRELRANPGEYMTIATCASDKEYKAYVDGMSKCPDDDMRLLPFEGDENCR
ncbi:hypothetical protein CASFOL_039104 [Castilleja foliolosa]|uniref:Uncharacterized protein n=1 Tax=Castilleja foliolosa TaxID=1961234 RepID=A0ABD3BH24_9LAMI